LPMSCVVIARRSAPRVAALLLILLSASCGFLEVGGEDAGRGPVVSQTPGSRWPGQSPGSPPEMRRVPPPVAKPSPPAKTAQDTLAALEPQRSASQETGMHRVRAGETIYGIAKQHNVDAYTLINVNRLIPPFYLSEGQRLVIPQPGSGMASGAVVAARPPASASGAASSPPEDAREAPKQQAAREASPSPRTAAPLTKMPQEAGGFIWPIEGRLLSEFGAKGGGLYNDGINIAGRTGASVRAAESGVVAYAGNEVRGFGNMLLIKHDGGWVTAYAHNDALLVERGDRVKRGQVIARVGSTGSVDQPQLHFEIRKGKKAVDPLDHLPRPSAAATGGRDAG
jgi:murein DD-endopeptidase MepM/ murein hydrolase activator NlpD